MVRSIGTLSVKPFTVGGGGGGAACLVTLRVTVALFPCAVQSGELYVDAKLRRLDDEFPLGNVEPHVDLGFGWTGLGSFNGAVAGDADAISMHGVYARVGGGLDYYLSPLFSVGLAGSIELVHLARAGISTAQIATIKALPSLTSAERDRVDLLGTEATSNGGAFSATGQLGLHF